MADLVVCQRCGAVNQPGQKKCSSCGSPLAPPGLEFLLDIEGLEPSLIQKLYLAGYKSAEDLKKAKVRELVSVEGISRGLAERIKQYILKHELVSEERVSLYICSNCGALLSENATKCPKCGAIVQEEVEKTEEVERIEEEKILKELEKPKITLFICSNCGAFVSSDAKSCPHCGALMEASEEAEEGEAEIKIEESDGSIIGICSSCGAFLAKNAKTCPICGTAVENPISIAINSTGSEKVEAEIEPEYAISSFDPKLETEGKIFLCEVCGAFVSRNAETCPICNSPTQRMRKEVLSVGPKEMGKEEILNLLEKEITRALDAAKEIEEGKIEEGKVEESTSEEEELPEFELVESEISAILPEHVVEEKEATEEVEHLMDVHSAVTAELGDLLAEEVVREKFAFDESLERVEHLADPIGEVESELWEYFFEEEEVREGDGECPICGYKNSPGAVKCEICGSVIGVEERKEEGKREKVKKLVVVEEKKPHVEFKEVKAKEIRVKKVVSKKPNFIEKHLYPFLLLSLASIGGLSLLIFGLSLLAVGVIAIGFLAIGGIFSYIILRKSQKEEVIKLPSAKKPSEIALFNMGTTYLATGRFEEAVKAFEEVVKLNPENEVAWNNLGSGLSKLERHEEALKCYDKALSLKPDFEIAWNNKGNALARLGRFEEALKCYDRAIELKREYYDAWVNKGYVLVKMGRYADAIACANEANKLLERSYG